MVSTPVAGHVKWEPDASGRPKKVLPSESPAPLADEATPSEANAEPSAKQAKTSSSTEYDPAEAEKALAWKKEKRRKQNREAQRRRRDRLMNQHKQKQAEMEASSNTQSGPGQPPNNPAGQQFGGNMMPMGFQMPQNGMQVAQPNMDQNEQFGMNMNQMNMRYNNFANPALQQPSIIAGTQMNTLQRQNSFGAPPQLISQNSFQDWNSANVGLMQNYTMQRRDSFSGAPPGMPNFSAGMPQQNFNSTDMAQNQAPNPNLGDMRPQGSFSDKNWNLGFAPLLGQNSFSMGNDVNPLFKQGSFAPPDFGVLLRQDSEKIAAGNLTKQLSFGNIKGGLDPSVFGQDPLMQQNVNSTPLFKQDSFSFGGGNAQVNNLQAQMFRQDSFSRLPRQDSFNLGGAVAPGLFRQDSLGKLPGLGGDAPPLFRQDTLGSVSGLSTNPLVRQDSASRLVRHEILHSLA
eukprot:747673-Hanusia_phi.AAC.6